MGIGGGKGEGLDGPLLVLGDESGSEGGVSWERRRSKGEGAWRGGGREMDQWLKEVGVDGVHCDIAILEWNGIKEKGRGREAGQTATNRTSKTVSD